MNPYQSPHEEPIRAELVRKPVGVWEILWRVFIVALILITFGVAASVLFMRTS